MRVFRRASVSAALAAISCGWRSSAAQETVQNLLKTATERFVRKDYVGAIADCSRALELETKQRTPRR
jgi:hypothetical protein